MTSLTIEEFELNVHDALARAEAGETIAITRGGEPVLQVSPCLKPWEIALGIRRATLPISGFERPHLVLDGPVDSVELIREERAERDLLS